MLTQKLALLTIRNVSGIIKYMYLQSSKWWSYSLIYSYSCNMSWYFLIKMLKKMHFKIMYTSLDITKILFKILQHIV